MEEHCSRERAENTQTPQGRTPQERAEALLAELSLPEKMAQIRGVWGPDGTEAGQQKFTEGIRCGIGQVSTLPLRMVRNIDEAAAWQRKAQQINAGEMELSIRQWSGKPYNSQQVEVARLSHLEVQRFEAAYGSTDPQPRVWIDGCEVADVEQVAHNDGLELAEWQEWFFKHTNHFEGVVLQFTSFKY